LQSDTFLQSDMLQSRRICSVVAAECWSDCRLMSQFMRVALTHSFDRNGQKIVVYLWKQNHFGSLSWSRGRDIFGIGHHFHCQILAALMTSPHGLLCSPRGLLCLLCGLLRCLRNAVKTAANTTTVSA
jgi:hypothetical protein